MIAAWVLVYNGFIARDGELLSEKVDDWLKAYPVTTRLVILALSAHLANAISPNRDVISIAFATVRKVHRRATC